MIQKLAFCLSGLLVIHGGFISRAKPDQVIDRIKRVEHAQSRPDLAARFEHVAQIKIASRKINFHSGEMISLDIALLNVSSQPLFFRNLSEMKIEVKNSVGQPVRVQEYGVADRAVAPNSFTRLPSNEMIVRSFQLLAGCDERAFAQVASNNNDDPAVFKTGSFLNWGDGCLPNKQPEIYIVSVQIKNDFVLLPRMGRVMTAVGTIKSNSLEIRIGS